MSAGASAASGAATAATEALARVADAVTAAVERVGPSRATAEKGLMALGAATAAVIAYRSVRRLWQYALRPSTDLLSRYGGGTQEKCTWAVVTGGSSGVGLACGHRLAAAGFNVLLVARSLPKLQKAAAAIEAGAKGVRVEVASLDAAAAGPAEVDEFVRLHLAHKDVGMLVNNVGVHNHVPANVEDMDVGDVQRIIAVNCTFTVLLTRAVVPLLRAHAGKAAVLNVSSLTSTMPMPMLTVYAATKAFGVHFSRCLAGELEPFGIDVMCARPGLTATPMSDIKEPSFFVPSADTMARTTLQTMGSQTCCLPYFPHYLLQVLGGVMPDSMQNPIVRNMHQAKREKLLAQRAEGDKRGRK